MNEKIRVVVADDHPIIIEGLRLLMSSLPDIEVVGEATTGNEALRIVKALQPDVISLDLQIPRISGPELILQIHAESPNTRVLIFTAFADDDYALPALQAGAVGYLLKGISLQNLIQ